MGKENDLATQAGWELFERAGLRLSGSQVPTAEEMRQAAEFVAVVRKYMDLSDQERRLLVARCVGMVQRNIAFNRNLYSGMFMPNLQSVADLCVCADSEIPAAPEWDRIERLLQAGKPVFTDAFDCSFAKGQSALWCKVRRVVDALGIPLAVVGLLQILVWLVRLAGVI